MFMFFLYNRGSAGLLYVSFAFNTYNLVNYMEHMYALSMSSLRTIIEAIHAHKLSHVS